MLLHESVEDDLKHHLNILQNTSQSLCNSAVNILAIAFAYGSVVGILGLWLSGSLERNQSNKGNSHLFFTFGQKQQAEMLIHQAQSLPCGALDGCRSC
ncbi:MAG: hypothetical protein NXI01_10170 [Gammaproteobacteria bacterium]|nr:hypothetical protein [Gammaproteobacteria bacterium]